MDDFKFEFQRRQTSKIPREKIFEELEKVAKSFGYKDFTQDQFNDVANIHHYTAIREFGTWEKTLKLLQEELKEKGIDFEITTRRSKYSNQEIFDEMERIWRLLGHRPSENEWTAINPKISYDTAYRRFGGWSNACLKFIEYKSGGEITAGEKTTEKHKTPETNREIKTKNRSKNSYKIEKSRTIPLSIRVKVLSRDNFRCVFCGKSPATDIGTKLHIDHIVSFANGGENTLENLQTLCEECNLGKSNRIVKNMVK
jgi:5-methylcytosine-specific restriction endonuclease McrA